MVTALQQLRLQQISTSLSAPLCDARIGTYLSNQCDQEAHCWCVDKITGRPVLGTRKPQPITDVCMNRRTCPIECDNSQIEACPFGIEMDADGCPRTSQCLCKSPCDQIQCPHGQSCIMRHRQCQEEICLPVPVCEPNPCANNQKPAVDSRTLSHLMCNDNNMELCPGGFHCTAFDENAIGVCCPGKDPILSVQQTLCVSSGVSLPLLSSFPANTCSISGEEDKICSHTHYCVTKEGHSRGTCCPGKRYVCDLPKEEGSCTQATPRFYYDSVSESCLQFLYTGCHGNLNNFLSLNDCQKFCAGTSMDPIRALVNDDGTLMMDLYDVGFAMVGPLARAEKHDADFNSVLREYLLDNFNLQDREIRDLYVKDDNTVRFTIIAPDAKDKADNISDAIVAGKFHFIYKSDMYRAEPQTLFSQQTSPNTSLSDGATVFWLVLTASILFAVVVIIVLCFGYNFLRLRNATENTNSIYREVSPAPYGQIAAYLQHQQQRISPNIRHSSDYGHINVKAVSADDLNAIRRNASAIASGTHHVALPALPNGHLSITNSLPQTNNGRSIRTVYY
ncbi:kunitz/Bovine pancreatic trypsin inhibitor domain-containing protein [Ditylenchus destructor]|uniref:Kunitz/Bovine pancreatic trypsin inhibitor domain-containing protein n=1 Tax=Ditylenchus destructor TaxID=166010 RepID=A0AAD4R6K1_9BILA|nr:kunitz/Bovine pancreatic trypsin inhibitor domain-containing protein [Ditylenchus destructor]